MGEDRETAASAGDDASELWRRFLRAEKAQRRLPLGCFAALALPIVLLIVSPSLGTAGFFAACLVLSFALVLARRLRPDSKLAWVEAQRRDISAVLPPDVSLDDIRQWVSVAESLEGAIGLVRALREPRIADLVALLGKGVEAPRYPALARGWRTVVLGGGDFGLCFVTVELEGDAGGRIVLDSLWRWSVAQAALEVSAEGIHEIVALLPELEARPVHVGLQLPHQYYVRPWIAVLDEEGALLTRVVLQTDFRSAEAPAGRRSGEVSLSPEERGELSPTYAEADPEPQAHQSAADSVEDWVTPDFDLPAPAPVASRIAAKILKLSTPRAVTIEGWTQPRFVVHRRR